MTTLLYLEASPRKSRSASIMVAQTFLDAYTVANPNDEIETIDLWTLPLPEFDGDTIAGKYAIMEGQDQDSQQIQAWREVVALADRFKAADKYLLSVPMWNFSIPYKLKHFIDIVTQPGLTFTVSPTDGYVGLVTGKPVTVIYARGGTYPTGSPAAAMDLQMPYMQLWLNFIGFQDIRTLAINPTLGGADTTAQIKATAVEEAQKLAQEF